MGDSGRRAARRLRAGQVPRRHSAHDGHSPPGRRPRADERSGAPHEGAAGRRRHNEPGPGAAPGLRRGLLQHLSLPAPRSCLPRAATAASGRFRGVPRRLLAKRPGGPGEVQVPQPDSDLGRSRRAGLPDREVSRQLGQPQPEARHERRRLRATGGSGQPRHGHGLRRAHPPLQRGEQRGGGGALHPARCRAAHGSARLSAGCRRGPVRHLPGLRRRVRHRRDVDGRRRDADAAGRRAGQGDVGLPVRPGGEPGDLRHQQGRPHPEGGGRRGRQRAVRLHPLRRRIHSPGVRLHALQSALRQELEERPGAHGRQVRDQGPSLRRGARRRPGALPHHPLQRRPDDVPGQHAEQDEARQPNGQPRRRGPQRKLPLHRRRPGRGRATSAAGLSRTTGWKPSSPCRSTCSTTPASPPTSGS